MKRIVLVLTIFLAITSFGCSGSTPEDLFDTAKLEELQDNHEHARELYQPPEDLFDTAKLEELQDNHEHARELYQQIIEKYPESEYAKQSKERLTKMKLN
ncbi:MAG: hypothetical protein JRF28_11290 [Deltaproteobacteria bacterium]|nr:hypothetical protein [Deltaproteobacteria bacterium]